MEFNPLTIRHATARKQLSTAHNIFKATASTYFGFSQGIVKVTYFYILLLLLATGSVIPEGILIRGVGK